jgi:integration host factor subunit alpha
MTKAEIVEAVQKSVDLPKKDIVELVEGVFEMIRERLEQGEDIKLPGFGNFLIREKNQRVGRNPKTGEEMMITARKIVSFKPSQILRERVNSGKRST